MKVIFEICGSLKEKFPFTLREFELPENSSVLTLIHRIDREAGEELPPSVWNSEKRIFRGPIALSIDGMVVKDYSTRLKENQHIKCNRFLIGG